jgi:hypothetical protein
MNTAASPKTSAELLAELIPGPHTLTVDEILAEFKRLDLWLVRSTRHELSYGPLFSTEDLPDVLFKSMRARHDELWNALPFKSDKQLAVMLVKYKREFQNPELTDNPRAVARRAAARDAAKQHPAPHHSAEGFL